MKAFSIPAVWVVVLLLWVLTLGASKAGSQEQFPEQSAFLTTCNAAKQIGQVGGVKVTRCRKVEVLEDGNFALVTVKVWVEGVGVFLVRAAYQKTVWMQSALEVAQG